MRTSLVQAVLVRPGLSSSSSAALGLAMRRTLFNFARSPSKPYAFGLTAANNYPVYNQQRAARSAKFTVIKKVEGDKKALAADLAALLNIPVGEVKIQPTNGVLIISGHHLEPIMNWLVDTFGDMKHRTKNLEAAAPDAAAAAAAAEKTPEKTAEEAAAKE